LGLPRLTDLLLDTSAVSAAMAGNELLDAFLGKLEPRTEIFTSVIVEGEVRFGLARLADGQRKEDLTAAFEDVLSTMHDILPASRDTAADYARLKAQLLVSGTPIGENDMWIAATARVRGLRVLTSDPDFDAVPDLSVASWSDRQLP
jgi:predicted nucleic acid-binding protein